MLYTVLYLEISSRGLGGLGGVRLMFQEIVCVCVCVCMRVCVWQVWMDFVYSCIYEVPFFLYNNNEIRFAKFSREEGVSFPVPPDWTPVTYTYIYNIVSSCYCRCSMAIVKKLHTSQLNFRIAFT